MSTPAGFHRRAPVWNAEERSRWPSFKPTEFDCKGNGEYWHHPKALDMLQALRFDIRKPLVINSGHRSAEHNAKVRGVWNSQHREWAADISTNGHNRAELARAAIRAGFTGIGFGSTFLHVDPRPWFVVWRYSGSIAPWAQSFGFDPIARFKREGRTGLLRI